MDDYEIQGTIGQGSYGIVLQAIHQPTGGQVAIKRLNKEYNNWKECSTLPEVESLKQLNHPNIVKLFGIVKSNNQLHLVFEHMKSNLYELIKQKAEQQKAFHESLIRNIMYQVLTAVSYIHGMGYIHRDLKPENILVTLHTVKIADFGQCVGYDKCRTFQAQAFYVATRWYRAPELLLKEEYDFSIDMWAIGCLMAELYQLAPLFPGRNETDQLNMIIKLVEPNSDKRIEIRQLHLPASQAALDLITRLLEWNPSRRISAAAALVNNKINLLTA